MNERDEEWGPWIEHDGKGFPVPVGTVVKVQGSVGNVAIQVINIANSDLQAGYLTEWHWAFWPSFMFLLHEHIIRYRIRKPRGMAILEDLLEQIDAPEKVEVPA